MNEPTSTPRSLKWMRPLVLCTIALTGALVALAMAAAISSAAQLKAWSEFLSGVSLSASMLCLLLSTTYLVKTEIALLKQRRAAAVDRK